MVFRGIIIGCLEKRYNKIVAIIIPSVIFGAHHILGQNLDFISLIQLLIAGSIVGILFSLIAIESDSIWNSTIVHSVWDLAIIGSILHIGIEANSNCMFNFVLDNKSSLISGGGFGIEASILSTLVY